MTVSVLQAASCGCCCTSGIPHGTKLGSWLLLLMINDLRLDDACALKYVDDTTIAEIVHQGFTQ